MEKIFFYALILFLPTQLGKHFWPDLSSVSGIRIDYLSPTIYFTDLLIVGLFVSWAIFNFQFSIFNQFFKTSIFKKLTFLVVVIFLTINILLSNNIFGGFYVLLKFLEFSFVAFYVATVLKEKDVLRKIAVALSVGVVFESLLAFAQFAKQGSVGGVLYFLGERFFTMGTSGIANASIDGELILRPYGTFPHPNVLAGYLVIALTCIVFANFKFQISNFKKGLFFFSFVLGTLALLFTMSRVAIVLWIVLLLIGIMVRIRDKLRLLSLGMILFGALLAVYAISPNLIHRFSQTSFSEEAVVQREELMQSAAVMIDRQTGFGVGLGNFLPTLATIQKPVSLGLYLQPVHNIFLLVAAETGVIGFMFFTGFLYATFLKARKHLYLLFMFLAVLVLGFFDHYFLTLQQGQLLLALVVGLCWGVQFSPVKK